MLITVMRFPSVLPPGPVTGFTDGLMLVDRLFFGYTVEDQVRAAGEKVAGRTAIPKGRYLVTVENSPRFSAKLGHPVELPRLHEVPGFEGVLIHGGNTADDSEGCILVASNFLAPGKIQGSLSNALAWALKQAKGPHYLEILQAWG